LFEGGNSQVVRSIQQRDLLNKWLSLYAVRKQPPRFADYDPGLPEADRAKLVYYSITFDSERPRFRIESYGSYISEAYGATGLGSELSDYLGPERAPLVVPVYEECIRRRLPVYTISRFEDDERRQVDQERLLLPFGDDEHVTHVIGSFETISMDGHFRLQRLMADHPPVEVLRAVIDRDLHFTPPPRIPPDHRVEFE